MSARTALLIVVTLHAGWMATGAIAQDGDSSAAGQAPGLRERLEQFRQDLLGEPPANRNNYGPASADRKAGANPQQQQPQRQLSQQPSAQPRLAQPKQRPTTSQNAPSNAAPPATIPGAVNSAVTTPSRMEVQTARRATPNLNLNGDPPVDKYSPGEKQRAARAAKKAQTAAKRPPSESDDADSDQADQDKANHDKSNHEKADRDNAEREKRDRDKIERDAGEPHTAKHSPANAAPKKLPTGDEADVAVAKREQAGKVASVSGGAGVLFTSQSPALSVEVAGPRRVLIGKEAQFIVKIVNSGSAANDVVVAVNIPTYAEILSAQPTVGAAQAPLPGEQHEPLLQWRISRLEAHTTETMNLRLVPRKSSPLDLGVKWTFAPEASQALVEVQEPKLAMAISGPDEVLFGQSKIYKLIVSNPGNGDTENVMVGLLPIGGAGEGSANHRLGTLKAGESKTIDIELTARQAGAITIKAQAFADGGLRSEAAEQVLVRRGSLLLEVEAPKVKYAGTVGTYHVKVVNAGNATAENVQVAALLPPEAKYVASSGGGHLEPQQGKIKWAVGTLQAGGERHFEMQCSLATPGENRMQFITMADGNLNAAAMSSTHVEAIADLKLEVRDPQGPIAVGEDTVYEVHIRNRGTKAAEGVDLTVFFSDGLEASAVEGGPHDIGPGQVVFRQIPLLPANEVAVYRVHAKADKGGNHVFRAEVTCASLNTKLATEETTHFYGDDKAAAGEPTAALRDSASAANDSRVERQ